MAVSYTHLMDNRTSMKRAEVALAKAITRIKVYGG